MVIDLNNLLNVLQASRRLGIHPDTVKRLIYQERLPAVKVGNTWLIERDKLEAFAKAYQPKRGRKERNK